MNRPEVPRKGHAALHTPSEDSQWRIALPVHQHSYSLILQDQGVWVPRFDSSVAVKVFQCDVHPGCCTRLVKLDANELLPLHTRKGQRTLVVWSGRIQRGAQMIDHGVCVDEPLSDMLWRAVVPSLVLELLNPFDARTSSVVDTSTASWEQRGTGSATLELIERTIRRAITLIDLQPGAVFDATEHAARVERFVLTGNCHVGDVRLSRGDYLRGEGDSGIERITAGPDGCVLLRALRDMAARSL